MAKLSAGLLMFRRNGDEVEVFLVHPGGPFFAKKDLGVWTIPKGEYVEDEEPLDAAKREFLEETGFAPDGTPIALGTIQQKSGKIVTAWAIEGDCDPVELVSNTCMIEWPPKTGRQLEIPEVDRGAWFGIDEARQRIIKAQEPLLDRLLERLAPGN